VKLENIIRKKNYAVEINGKYEKIEEYFQD